MHLYVGFRFIQNIPYDTRQSTMDTLRKLEGVKQVEVAYPSMREPYGLVTMMIKAHVDSDVLSEIRKINTLATVVNVVSSRVME